MGSKSVDTLPTLPHAPSVGACQASLSVSARARSDLTLEAHASSSATSMPLFATRKAKNKISVIVGSLFGGAVQWTEASLLWAPEPWPLLHIAPHTAHDMSAYCKLLHDCRGKKKWQALRTCIDSGLEPLGATRRDLEGHERRPCLTRFIFVLTICLAFVGFVDGLARDGFGNRDTRSHLPLSGRRSGSVGDGQVAHVDAEERQRKHARMSFRLRDGWTHRI